MFDVNRRIDYKTWRCHSNAYLSPTDRFQRLLLLDDPRKSLEGARGVGMESNHTHWADNQVKNKKEKIRKY